VVGHLKSVSRSESEFCVFQKWDLVSRKFCVGDGVEVSKQGNVLHKKTRLMQGDSRANEDGEVGSRSDDGSR
jgi:hypothetical protein